MNAESEGEHPTGEYGVVTAPDTLRLERLLPGPIERVWSWLTEPDKRGRWLASGDMDLRAGGAVELVFRNSELSGRKDPPPEKYAAFGEEARLSGEITECEPPYRLAYTWGEPSGEPSHVRFELSRLGEQVLLVLVHTRIAQRDDMLGAAAGWHAHLAILLDRLGGRSPRLFWPLHTRLEEEYANRIPPPP